MAVPSAPYFSTSSGTSQVVLFPSFVDLKPSLFGVTVIGANSVVPLFSVIVMDSPTLPTQVLITFSLSFSLFVIVKPSTVVSYPATASSFTSYFISFPLASYLGTASNAISHVVLPAFSAFVTVFV